MRDLATIEADFHRIADQRLTAFETLNTSLEAICSRRLDSLLLEAIDHPQYKAAKEPANG